MNSVRVVCVLAALVAVASAAERYTTKFDNINIDDLLRNDRLLSKHLMCLLNQDNKGCTAEALELKNNIRDALETGCKKCSQKQREGTEKVFKYLITNKPNEFAALEKKYDPKKTYRARYQAEANKRHLKI